MQSKLVVVGTAILTIIVLVLGVAYVKTRNNIPSGEATSTALHFGTTSPNYTIETEPTVSIKDIEPSLTRGIHFENTEASAVRAILQKQYDELIQRLTQDPNRADDWFSLGVTYHSANDYDGARGVWEFLLKVISAPQSAVVYDNLGKLYKFNLKDFPKSESYFKASIQADPNSLTPYLELHELYRYLYKTETTAAADILVSAAAKFPTSLDPLVLLAEYYRDRGDTAKARDAYMQALDRARANEDTGHVQSIEEELANLPK